MYTLRGQYVSDLGENGCTITPTKHNRSAPCSRLQLFLIWAQAGSSCEGLPVAYLTTILWFFPTDITLYSAACSRRHLKNLFEQCIEYIFMFSIPCKTRRQSFTAHSCFLRLWLSCFRQRNNGCVVSRPTRPLADAPTPLVEHLLQKQNETTG